LHIYNRCPEGCLERGQSDIYSRAVNKSQAGSENGRRQNPTSGLCFTGNFDTS
jgi:hypothetical protein